MIGPKALDTGLIRNVPPNARHYTPHAAVIDKWIADWRSVQAGALCGHALKRAYVFRPLLVRARYSGVGRGVNSCYRGVGLDELLDFSFYHLTFKVFLYCGVPKRTNEAHCDGFEYFFLVCSIACRNASDGMSV